MTLVRWLGMALVVFSLQARLVSAAPEDGWWWNPAENGRGFFIEIQDDFAFIGAYAYTNDGHPYWVVSQGSMASPTSYDGRLLSFAGGQTLVGDYRAPGTPSDVGAITIDFIDDQHARLTWPGGTIPIERLTFDPGASPLPIHTGWWWNEAESGTGWSIELQGNTLFAVGFMFDNAGQPVWYLSAGAMKSRFAYEGTLLQFSNGQPIIGAYRPPSAPITAGSLKLDFSGPSSAQLTVTDAPSAMALSLKRASSKGVKTLFKPGRLAGVPPSLFGDVHIIAAHEFTGPLGTTRVDEVIRGEADFGLPRTVGVNAAYTLFRFNAGLLTAVASDAVPAADGSSCTGNGGDFVSFDAPPSSLTIEPSGRYHFNLSGPVRYTLTLICTVRNVHTPPLILPQQLSVEIKNDDDVHVDKRTKKWSLWFAKDFSTTLFNVTTSWEAWVDLHQ